MSRNVYKFNQITVQKDDALKIDNNEKVAKKIEYLESLMLKEAADGSDTGTLDGFTAGLDMDRVDILLADEENSLSDAARSEKADSSESLKIVSAQVQDMLAEARNEAENIKNEILMQAQKEAEVLRQRAFEEGKAQGYEVGYNESLAQFEEQKKDLQEQRIKLEKEYRELVSELEPKFVDSLTGIYERIFKVDLSKERGIIMHLISSAMHKIEGSSSYLIHVSKEDYAYVSMKKEELLTGTVPANASVEIIEDIMLLSGDCMIETDGGVFDCGLGTQLEELSQKLRLLSYTKGQY